MLLAGCRGGGGTERAAPRGTYHRVEQGQTLWSIARAYGIDPKTLARVNHLSEVGTLYVGQRLYIPGATARLPVTGPGAEASSPSGQASLPPPSARPQDKGPAEQFRFIWPVQGTVTRAFEQQSKQRHDGIDIVAPEGTPIQAAADGKVIFSDWGPGGYGRIVILQHGPDLVTVYAHNQRNLVQAGQSVRQGDQIATVGKSGRATGYHLHFEIRRKTVPVSPSALLPPSRQIARSESR